MKIKQPHSVAIKARGRLAASLAFLLATLTPRESSAALTVQQAPGASSIVFEAENTHAIINGTPEIWEAIADSAASGGRGLLANGSNSTGNSPHSFAHYRLRFATPGAYYLYYRWKADATRTAGDVFTANSSWIGATFGAFSTPADQAPHIRTDSNNTQAPANNTYAWRRELESITYTVDGAQVGQPLVLTVGTREAGMVFDKFVLSTDPALSEAALEALANSETDVVTQGAGESYVAFEAEAKARIIAGTPETWQVLADSAASGGGGIIAAGENSTGNSPHSFAHFEIRFATQGAYYVYYRWKADATRTAGDVFTANSSWIGTTFGAFSTPGDQSTYVRTDSNNTQAPANNVYEWRRELESVVYPVGAAEVGTSVFLTLGTREAGMVFDRLVLSVDSTLTAVALDALVNTGAKAAPLELTSAVGSAALNTVTVRFNRPVNPATAIAGNFAANAGLSVTGVAVDPDDARVVRITTSAQTQGTRYTLTANRVKDTSGAEIPANSSIAFSAWKRVSGWVTKEVYFGIPGTSVFDLQNDPRYLARRPDRLEFVRGFQLNADPQTDNYGARLSGFFTPAQTGNYDFFYNNDDEMELLVGSNMTEESLVSYGVFPLSPPPFSDFAVVQSDVLTANQQHLVAVLLKQGGGDVYVNLAARRAGQATPPADQLQPIGGDRISTFVNPDLGVVEFAQDPASTQAPVGGRARFAIAANLKASPVYYQWQLNGVNIDGATRPAYVTPALTQSHNNGKYRCVVSVAGVDSPSAEATLTVIPGQPSPQQPFVGVNFVGGGGGSIGSRLHPAEVAGVVRQENWNNLAGFNFAAAPLVDAAGQASPVTLSVELNTETWYSGTIVTGDADGALLQGFVTAGASREPIAYRLAGVPPGKYQLIAYSVGFDFSASYLQAYELVAGESHPILYGRAETGLPYTQNAAFRQMGGTNPDNRATGNYVLFDNVSPASDGSLTLSVTWDSPADGNSHQPAVNAIQLVKVVPVATPVQITAVSRSGGNVSLTWTGGNGPFKVQWKERLADAAWVDAATTANRNASVASPSATGFFRIQGN